MNQDFHSFKLNDNGLLNKRGENIIYSNSTEIVKFGVYTVSNSYLSLAGGFLSLYPGHGFGKASIKFLFFKLRNINEIWLESHDNILPFWQKCGGIVIERTYNHNNVVAIYREKINLVI